MDYELYQNKDNEIVKVYKNYNGSKYYLDIDNRYDKLIDSDEELKQYLQGATFIGYDHD